MSWFNYYGLIAVVIILIPNILCSVFDKGSFENKVDNKPLIIFEQTGRYGCMAFMTFNIPYTYFGFWFENALTVYLAVGGTLLAAYCLGWLIFGKSKSIIKALYLSITPAVLFLFCGILVSAVPLTVCAILFGVCHIAISYKNAKL